MLPSWSWAGTSAFVEVIFPEVMPEVRPAFFTSSPFSALTASVTSHLSFSDCSRERSPQLPRWGRNRGVGVGRVVPGLHPVPELATLKSSSRRLVGGSGLIHLVSDAPVVAGSQNRGKNVSIAEENGISALVG